MTPEELINKVKEIKKKRRLTRGRLAKLIGVDPEHIAYIENERVGYVPLPIRKKIEFTLEDLEDL